MIYKKKIRGDLKNMKKYVMGFGIVAIALLMVSSATAVPANKAAELDDVVSDLKEKLSSFNGDGPQAKFIFSLPLIITAIIYWVICLALGIPPAILW